VSWLRGFGWFGRWWFVGRGGGRCRRLGLRGLVLWLWVGGGAWLVVFGKRGVGGAGVGGLFGLEEVEKGGSEVDGMSRD